MIYIGINHLICTEVPIFCLVAVVYNIANLQITIPMDERRQRRESQYNKYTVRELSANLTTVRTQLQHSS